MQFNVISLSVLALLAVQAHAAAVDAAIERRTGMAALAGCVCSKDKTGVEGQHVAEGLRWYQCQYSEGACAWNDLGVLLNTKQANCKRFAPCIMG